MSQVATRLPSLSQCCLECYCVKAVWYEVTESDLFSFHPFNKKVYAVLQLSSLYYFYLAFARLTKTTVHGCSSEITKYYGAITENAR
jgi:hypothetical protein